MIIQIVSRFRLSGKWKKTDPGEIVKAISVELITFEQLAED
jgi:hypothetical protein